MSSSQKPENEVLRNDVEVLRGAKNSKLLRNDVEVLLESIEFLEERIACVNASRAAGTVRPEEAPNLIRPLNMELYSLLHKYNEMVVDKGLEHVHPLRCTIDSRCRAIVSSDIAEKYAERVQQNKSCVVDCGCHPLRNMYG